MVIQEWKPACVAKAKGRNGYFNIHRVWATSIRTAGQVWVEIYSKSTLAQAPPARIEMAPSDLRAFAYWLLAHADELDAEMKGQPS